MIKILKKKFQKFFAFFCSRVGTKSKTVLARGLKPKKGKVNRLLAFQKTLNQLCSYYRSGCTSADGQTDRRRGFCHSKAAKKIFFFHFKHGTLREYHSF
jgi:hypothetical protein